MKYTIDSIDSRGLTITYTSDDPNVVVPNDRGTQTLSLDQFDLQDVDNLKQQLSEQAKAFENGLRQEQNLNVSEEVQALIGRQQTAGA